MVSVYKALDEKQIEKLSIKDKFKHYKEELDVEIELRYFNWALNSEDYWDRQIHVDVKLKDGYVIEKYTKSGFGEFGYIKPGDTETKDIYRNGENHRVRWSVCCHDVRLPNRSTGKTAFPIVGPENGLQEINSGHLSNLGSNPVCLAKLLKGFSKSHVRI